MRPLLLLLAAALLTAAADTPPKPKPATGLRLRQAAPCIAGQACSLVLTWTPPANFNPATDTAWVDWNQTEPTALALTPDHPVSGTRDTLTIPSRSDGKPKSGPVTLCHTRVNYPGRVCNAPVPWILQGTVPTDPPDTATGVVVEPASAALRGGDTLRLRARPGA